ncbi:hypothetical protein [Kitasatospora sp. NPDC089509]|uniref:hypothetical protein n=1 Tax=Kitasatospora sp. NPDC089509 TaxID=3364079 RepID=UPI0037FC637C
MRKLLEFAAITALIAGLSSTGIHAASAQDACSSNAVVIVAHPDDALVFMHDNVRYQRAIGNCVHLVSMTSYYDDVTSVREEAARAAYQKILDANAPDDTVQHFDTTIRQQYGNYVYHTYRIHNSTDLTLSFLRLPASTYPGFTEGSVYSRKDDQTIVSSLKSFLEAKMPDRVYTLNTQGLLYGINECVVQQNGFLSANECDHYDHVGTALLAKAAFSASAIRATLYEFHAYDMARGMSVNANISVPACQLFCAVRDAYNSIDTAAAATPWGALLSSNDMYSATATVSSASG